jgi:phenylalanyl-tRNA synthetase beta chain
VRRDLAIVLDKQISWEQVSAILSSQKVPYLQNFDLFDVFENEERIGKAKKSLAISLIFENPNQTLKESDLDLSMEQINKSLREKLGAIVR